MSFFDSKEELIKIELTNYGKFLLSKGKFKPTYYAFFDDDIIYDSLYANFEETQNSSQNRILNETPKLKPQSTYSSVESSIQKNKDLLFRDLKDLKQEESQISSDKNYSHFHPLGSSAYNTIYAPAWSIAVLTGSINSSQPFLDNSKGDMDTLSPFLKIPQINLNNQILTVNILVSPSQEQLINESLFNRTIGFVSSSTFITHDSVEYVFDVSEFNTINSNENFDIEIFVERQKSISVNDTIISSSYWHQIDFKKKSIEIKNNILLDEPETFSVKDDINLVDHYFDLTVDDEIYDAPSVNSSRGTYDSTVTDADKPFGNNC